MQREAGVAQRGHAAARYVCNSAATIGIARTNALKLFAHRA
jgi:hypothetical protein